MSGIFLTLDTTMIQLQKHICLPLSLLVVLAAGAVFPAAAEESDYIAVINIYGGDESVGQSSGTLPGSSPSRSAPLLLRSDGSPVPLWREPVLPRLAPGIARTGRAMMKLKNALQESRMQYRAVGDQKSFWVKDDLDASWRQITATVEGVGDHCLLYADDTLSLSASTVSLYIDEFEIMYDVVSENIGIHSDLGGDGKVDILLYDMNDGGTINGYIGGYFWSKDYYADSLTRPQGIRSNESDIIYIRGDEPEGWNTTGLNFYEYNLTTLVHEYQHLVHFGLKLWENDTDYSDTWIDEMMAMAAETMYFKEKLDADPSFTHPDMEGDGTLFSRIAYYNEDMNNSIRNGFGLTYWDYYGDTLANYALSYLFGQYLAAQSDSGQGIFKEIIDYMLSSGLHDYKAVAGAAAQAIDGVDSWADLMQNWAIANFLNLPSGPYGYNEAFTLTPAGPTSGKVTVGNSGVVYRATGGTWSRPSDAGPNIRYYGFDQDGAGDTTTSSSSTTTTTTTSTPSTTTTAAADTTTTSVASTTTTAIETTTSSSSTSVAATTTTSASGPCPAALVLGEGSEEVHLLRMFRDSVLSSSPAGSDIIRLYYRHAGELSLLLKNNPALKTRISKALRRLIPAAVRASAGRPLRMTPDLERELFAAAEALSAVGSPELRDALRQVLEVYAGALQAK